MSVIRQGRDDLNSEAFTAKNTVAYRVEKSGPELRLFVNYDDKGWHPVGGPVMIRLEPGGSDAVAMTHLRVLDISGAGMKVTADDFVWSGAAIKGGRK